MSDIAAAIDREIRDLQSKLDALQAARRALGGAGRGPGRPPTGRRKRRKLTAAEKANISRRMKAAWKRRKAAAGA
ncbi:MAG TPA: hypothetical protein VFV78_13850 [Vicinamibacterales bacterium]|nr:hypothetical protein [Vicinamibacterales bacterium]